jgi:ubiquinone/menaquinone biosynthesis C-methylase UbiE
MSDDAAGFVGDTPYFYDRGLGPVLFAGYADDLARRVVAQLPQRVLETAAGTGILTRRLRDLLPAAVRLVASDLNPPMIEAAKTKFRPGEGVEFRKADALSLPFEDGAFDVVVCQFSVMFFADKSGSYREVRRVLASGGSYVFNVWDAHRHNPPYRIAHEIVSSASSGLM